MQRIPDFLSIFRCQENANRLLTWLLSPLLPYQLTMAVPLSPFSCVFGHMRRRHSSHDSASPGAEASVKAARTLRAVQRAKRLDGRWSAGYFATGVMSQREIAPE